MSAITGGLVRNVFGSNRIPVTIAAKDPSGDAV
jgi:hypothetical protein